jgi:hypothetical protein
MRSRFAKFIGPLFGLFSAFPANGAISPGNATNGDVDSILKSLAELGVAGIDPTSHSWLIDASGARSALGFSLFRELRAAAHNRTDVSWTNLDEMEIAAQQGNSEAPK